MCVRACWAFSKNKASPLEGRCAIFFVASNYPDTPWSRCYRSITRHVVSRSSELHRRIPGYRCNNVFTCLTPSCKNTRSKIPRERGKHRFRAIRSRRRIRSRDFHATAPPSNRSLQEDDVDICCMNFSPFACTFSLLTLRPTIPFAERRREFRAADEFDLDRRIFSIDRGTRNLFVALNVRRGESIITPVKLYPINRKSMCVSACDSKPAQNKAGLVSARPSRVEHKALFFSLSFPLFLSPAASLAGWLWGLKSSTKTRSPRVKGRRRAART